MGPTRICTVRDHRGSACVAISGLVAILVPVRGAVNGTKEAVVSGASVWHGSRIATTFGWGTVGTATSSAAIARVVTMIEHACEHYRGLILEKLSLWKESQVMSRKLRV